MLKIEKPYIIIALIVLPLLISGVIISSREPINTNETSECPICEEITINNTKIVEKIVYKEKECPICEVCNITAKDQIDLTMPYIKQVKRLDRQLEECLYNNESYYNGTKEYLLESCQRNLNYTINMFKEWEIYVR